MGKFCTNCGKELNNEQNVCLNCGVNVSNEASQTVQNKTDKHAMIGFILGLVSIIAWIIPLFGYPVTICGIVFSAKGLNSKINKGKSIAGLILSIVFIVFTLINSIAGAVMNMAYYY